MCNTCEAICEKLEGKERGEEIAALVRSGKQGEAMEALFGAFSWEHTPERAFYWQWACGHWANGCETWDAGRGAGVGWPDMD